MEDTFTWISTPGVDMRLMYHNFGVVRENKELIRHRMFMTKLKPGCDEEYKARHDVLVEARQLEIMDWITNDVDWMTGEHHSSSRRLAWHA